MKVVVFEYCFEFVDLLMMKIVDFVIEFVFELVVRENVIIFFDDVDSIFKILIFDFSDVDIVEKFCFIFNCDVCIVFVF